MKYLSILTVLFVFGVSIASRGYAEEDSDEAAVHNCLRAWKTNPFKSEHPEFRTIGSQVRVLGSGKNVEDTAETPKPELVLVKPNVAVLSKSTLRLMNPNGWYCLKANVSVLGKSAIELNCKANLASSKDGASVLGANETGSVAVLGSVRVNRICR